MVDGLKKETNSDMNLDEWKNLENIVRTKIFPLCNRKGYNQDLFLIRYFEYYSRLNYNYNCANDNHFRGDIVDSDIAIIHQNDALKYLENIYL